MAADFAQQIYTRLSMFASSRSGNVYRYSLRMVLTDLRRVPPCQSVVRHPVCRVNLFGRDRSTTPDDQHEWPDSRV